MLRLLHSLGVASLLVEGGGRVITSMLRAAAADRVVVSLSPTIIGSGVEAVGPIGVDRVADGIRLVNRRCSWPATTSCSASTWRTASAVQEEVVG